MTERSAMQMTAVYSCVRILAEAIAGLPLHVYQQSSDGAKVKALDYPLYLLALAHLHLSVEQAELIVFGVLLDLVDC